MSRCIHVGPATLGDMPRRSRTSLGLHELTRQHLVVHPPSAWGGKIGSGGCSHGPIASSDNDGRCGADSRAVGTDPERGGAFGRAGALVTVGAQGWRVSELVRKLGLSEPTVRLWITRFNAQGLEGLKDAPR